MKKIGNLYKYMNFYYSYINKNYTKRNLNPNFSTEARPLFPYENTLHMT